MLPFDECLSHNIVAYEGDTFEDIFYNSNVKKNIINTKCNSESMNNSLKTCIQNTLYCILEIQDIINSSSFIKDMKIHQKCGSFLESLSELERYISNNVKITLYQDLTQITLKLLDDLHIIEENWQLSNYQQKNHYYYLIYHQIEEAAKLIKTLSKYCEKTQ